jgi:hypothetical protein
MMPWVSLFFHLILALPASATPMDLHGLCLELRSGDPLPEQHRKTLSNPALDRELESALKQPDQLRDAACVVAEAKRVRLLDSLFTIPTQDLTPEVFQALARIRTPQNEKQIQAKMMDWLGQPDREDSILRTLGALQILGDLKWNPNLKSLNGLLNSTIPEVRVASHDFLFGRFDRLSDKEQIDLMREAMKKNPIQVRISALRTFKSLSTTKKKNLNLDLKDCRKDEAPEVREECP